MRRSQGRPFSEKEVERIKFLLTSTDLTLEEIGTRVECAKSSVVAINQNYQIRQYRGRRSSWICTVTEKGGDTSGERILTMSGSH